MTKQQAPERYWIGLSRLFENLAKKVKEDPQWHKRFEIKKFGIDSEDLEWETPESSSDLLDTIAVVIAQFEEKEQESGLNQYNIERVIREKPKTKKLITPLGRECIYPYPERERLKAGTGYYVPFSGYHCWIAQTADFLHLDQGMVHLTISGKTQHEHALKAYYEDSKRVIND